MSNTLQEIENMSTVAEKTSYKRYDKYKDSGVEWISEIPEHWEILSGKKIFKERVLKGFPDSILLAATQNKGVIPKDEMEYRTVTALKNFETFKVVEVNDFVISLRSFEGGFEYSKHHGIISPAYTVFYIFPKHHSHIYWKWVFKSYPFLSVIRSLVRGIRDGQNISFNDFKYLNLPVPPQKEQAEIATFIATKIDKINFLIEKKRRLIEVLTEERTAIINQAVTKGIDPDVKLKPSGIEWLGDIPAHWEVKKLKYLCRLRDESTYESDFVIAVENIESETGKLVFPEENNYSGEMQKFYQGDTLFNKLRPYLHKVYYAEKTGAAFGELLILHPLDEIKSKFFFYILFAKGFINIVNSSTNGTKMPRANWHDFISQLSVAYPNNESEQEQIIAFIETKLNSIEKQSSILLKEIELLQEYKAALISETVTGKVKICS